MCQQTKNKKKKDVEHLASRIPLKCEGFFLLLPLNELSAIKTRTKEKLSRNKTIPETSFESKLFQLRPAIGFFFMKVLVWANLTVDSVDHEFFFYFEYLFLLWQTYSGNIVNKKSILCMILPEFCVN